MLLVVSGLWLVVGVVVVLVVVVVAVVSITTVGGRWLVVLCW